MFDIISDHVRTNIGHFYKIPKRFGTLPLTDESIKSPMSSHGMVTIATGGSPYTSPFSQARLSLSYYLRRLIREVI